MSTYLVSERFKSIQGEGVYAGTPMAFIRFVGCSVGKKTCNACDTDFEKAHAWRGGGVYTVQALLRFAEGFDHVCLTGGEPLDQDLVPLVRELRRDFTIHIETSGTRPIGEFLDTLNHRLNIWICISPKPGYLEDNLQHANEIKVIVPGLGSGDGWPSMQDALAWAERFADTPVFLQPRNLRYEIDPVNLALCQELVLAHPQLRLSIQLHKLLNVR